MYTMPFPRYYLHIATLSVGFLSAVITLWHSRKAMNNYTRRGTMLYTLIRAWIDSESPVLVDSDTAEDIFSYIGEDHPYSYPVGPLDHVAMTLYESVHFALNKTDASAGNDWDHLAVIPRGHGRVHLGPMKRTFVVVMYHQMHCLAMIHRALVAFDDPTWKQVADEHHIRHCLDYLRQGILCGAADSLEEGDFMQSDMELGRVGDTLICEDWEKVYEELYHNQAQWMEWKSWWN